MRKTINVCDICDREISENEKRNNYVPYGSLMGMELCDSCYSKIKEEVNDVTDFKNKLCEKEQKLNKRLQEMRNENEKFKNIHK